MCSNSLSVSTLTDWLMSLSREELALCTDSSLPCGSHCLQRSTKVLQEIMKLDYQQITAENEHFQLDNESFVLPERRAAVDQSYGPGNISVPSVSKFCLSLMKHLHLPLETGHIEVLSKPAEC